MNDFLSQISQSDQIEASVKSMSKLIADMFRELRSSGMSRSEAFRMTQTWIIALMGQARQQNG